MVYIKRKKKKVYIIKVYAHGTCVVRERRVGFVIKEDICISSRQMFLA